MKTARRLAILAGACALNQAAFAAPPPVQWLGLFNWDMIAWLDNVNRLAEICPATLADTAKTACEKDARAPKTETVKVFAAPKEDAELLGTLVLIALPGEGLFHAFKPVGREAKTFTPDLYDKDWGYGPYYHQTLSARQGDWFQLPKNPFPQPAWINARPVFSGKKGPLVEALEFGKVYTLDNQGIVISALGDNTVTLRAEQPIDMPCEGDEDPLLEGTEKQVPYADLFDSDGHLKLKIKYSRGC